MATALVAGSPSPPVPAHADDGAAGATEAVLDTLMLPASPGAPDGWIQVLAEDFATDVAEGEFADVYGDPSRAGGAWDTYDDWPNSAETSRYNAGRSVSVEDGILRLRIHTDADGIHRTEALLPPASDRLYGRYVLRFRVPEPLPGYKFVSLLWPSSDIWDQGEIDFPEAWLEPHGTIEGFSHHANVGAPQDNAMAVDTGVPIVGEWHTAEIVWAPDHVAFYLDGRLQGSTTTDVARDPMRWVIQTEGNLEGNAIDPGVDGYIEIDWVAGYARAPAAAIDESTDGDDGSPAGQPTTTPPDEAGTRTEANVEETSPPPAPAEEELGARDGNVGDTEDRCGSRRHQRWWRHDRAR